MRDRSGRVLDRSDGYDETVKAYHEMLAVRVGNNPLSAVHEKFAESAVRLCNKLTFPYEKDYEPPKQQLLISEEEFEVWTKTPNFSALPKIVEVVLPPASSANRQLLKQLVGSIPEGSTLVVMDFAGDNELYSDMLQSADRDIVVVTPILTGDLLVRFEHWRLNVTLVSCNEHCVLVRADLPRCKVEAVLHAERVPTCTYSYKK